MAERLTDKRIDELTPYERNPRKNDAAVEYVANSIREFGFKVPIVIDADGVIVAGHTRYKAAQKLGLETVPCIVADDLTPKQVKAFRLADNKVGEIAEWDFDLLDLELDEIENIDMSVFDFSDERLSDEELQKFMDEEVSARARETHRVVVDCNNAEETHMVEQLLRDNGYNPKTVNK